MHFDFRKFLIEAKGLVYLFTLGKIFLFSYTGHVGGRQTLGLGVWSLWYHVYSPGYLQHLECWDYGCVPLYLTWDRGSKKLFWQLWLGCFLISKHPAAGLPGGSLTADSPPASVKPGSG